MFRLQERLPATYKPYPEVSGELRDRELSERYPGQFRPEAIQNLLVNRATMWSFLRAEPFTRIRSWAEATRASFLQRRASYLIYP